ncbi:hypothetical protein AXF42_Ash013691 [Apostasia shenzhenica]|uniref:Cytochrome c-type biogenesis protein CcmE n=1 Tax=Apostasia shenzhenica TaxID=1088818 RepID=A0A2I0A4K6_9ASPA|nr:hypothetical protein AXF42_Ash013691 [Apostasia shenzhenica]
MASRLLRSRLSPLLRAAVFNPHSPAFPPIDPVKLSARLSVPSPPFLRHLSSATGRRHPSVAGRRPVDIGARARQLQNRRLWTYALTFSCVAGFIVIVLANFQDQLLFYITPSDALEKFTANPSKTRFRLGGLVMEGSVVYPSGSSPEMEFVITDLLTDILVRYEGSLPDLFREGHSAVVEGFLRPFSSDGGVRAASSGPPVTAKARSLDCYFRATEVLAKHDEKYMPKEVAEALEKNKKQLEKEMEAKALAGEDKN